MHFFLVLSLAAGSLAAAEKPSFNPRTGLYDVPFARLQKAADRDDRAEIERWADRLGPARLVAALGDQDALVVRAALAGAEVISGSVRLIDAVTPLLDHPAPEIASKACRVLGRMLDGGRPDERALWDVPPDAVARGCQGLRTMAASTAAAQDTRLSCVAALLEARTACSAVALPEALLRDPAPELRRAAWLATTGGAPPSGAVRTALDDPDPRVAGAAGAAVCRHSLSPLPGTPTGAPAAPTTTPARSLRDIVRADDVPAEDVIEILPCLARSGSPDDRAALEALGAGHVSPVRDRATELLGPRR